MLFPDEEPKRRDKCVMERNDNDMIQESGQETIQKTTWESPRETTPETMREELENLRKSIDEIDRAIIPLFVKRMSVAKKIAAIKHGKNWPVLDADREEQVIRNAIQLADGELAEETAALMRTLMTLSREYQQRIFTNS